MRGEPSYPDIAYSAAAAGYSLDETPSWFPDGKRIAFQSNSSGVM
jgi:Tol biopolymer transport system component